mmetsp:Transcript_13765/g.44893  ORF Transcript_13765/g.44893 Transcript_13765/m.44893 type:complete len:224 (+) Transcript_13765:64-735(+)|eukprot:CAMPEP_0118919942 /NCGR_PEP_ID=MMETSP1166-20130328/18820_1 /TAXON_ID=1104430 /ORGANISM="Chrysoreinhardia sp, Strain CCMP3193" /LENGTH=223 /DNA_ID=CAMNT_0006860479 /DNA_START=19 /DNA_END=690 /DNA_ORIENTATION=+
MMSCGEELLWFRLWLRLWLVVAGAWAFLSSSSSSRLECPAAPRRDVYAAFDGVECGDTSEQRLCAYDFDYASEEPERECFAYCEQWFPPSLSGEAVVDAAYGNPEAGSCCCTSRCACAAPSVVVGFLALALDGPTAANRTADLPPDCAERKSRRRNGRHRPFDLADLWWVLLFAILCLAAAAFFLKVEQVDKYRRTSVQQRPDDRAEEETPQAADQDTPVAPG